VVVGWQGLEAAVRSGGSGKVWRWRQGLEAAARSGGGGGEQGLEEVVSKGLEVAARSGGDGRLWTWWQARSGKCWGRCEGYHVYMLINRRGLQTQ
jgi:hypothetical protein